MFTLQEHQYSQGEWSFLKKYNAICYIDDKAYDTIKFYQTLKTSYQIVLTAIFVQLVKHFISPTFKLCRNMVYISTTEREFIYLGNI